MTCLGILEKNARELSILSTVTLFSYYFVNTEKKVVKQLEEMVRYFNFFVGFFVLIIYWKDIYLFFATCIRREPGFNFPSNIFVMEY